MSPLLRSVLAVAAAVLAAASLAAADAKPTGNWKFRFAEGERPVTLLFALTEADGKWVGDFIGSDPQFKTEPKIANVAVTDDAVKFSILLGAVEMFQFEGALAKDGKKISGSVKRAGGALTPMDVTASKLKKAESFDLLREDFAQLDGGVEVFEVGFILAGLAAEKKLSAEDARGIADKLSKTAGAYGPRWQRHVALKLAETFAGQAGFADIAVAQAQRAERMLAEDEPAAGQIEVLTAVATALTKAGKAEDAKKYQDAVAKLEPRDYADYTKATLTFETPAYTGRKAKSDRVVLIEHLTAAEAPPCVAADVALAGVLKTYKPTEVVLLRYHLHAGSPDILCNPDAIDRARGLAAKAKDLSVPMVFVNGRSSLNAKGGVGLPAAKDRYKELREIIDDQLEQLTAVKLTLSVAKDDKGYKATAKVADLVKPGEKVMLRFAVVESVVRYAGGSGTRFHPAVVRNLPGGAAGFALTKKEQEQTVTVNVDDIRKGLTKYIEDFSKEQGDFPKADRPLALKNLKLIAFVQDDATGEVLNAVQVELDGK